MPNILKGFLRPAVEAYSFPTSEELRAVQEAEKAAVQEAERRRKKREETGEEEEEPFAPVLDPKSPIDYARLQAEVIMEDARKRSDALLQEAQRQADELAQAARAEAHDDGYRDGFAEGRAAAMVEAQTQLEKQAIRLEAEVARYLESASHARESMLDETVEELKELALAVAEKIVRVSLKSSSQVIARMIQGAVEKLKRREWVHIYIAGCDAKGMAQVAPALTSSLAALSDHIKLVPMADDESGTLIIEMPDEIIDASASTQIANMRDLLTDSSYSGL